MCTMDIRGLVDLRGPGDICSGLRGKGPGGGGNKWKKRTKITRARERERERARSKESGERRECKRETRHASLPRRLLTICPSGV